MKPGIFLDFLLVVLALLMSGCAGTSRTDVSFAYLPGVVDLDGCGESGFYEPTQSEARDIGDCMSTAPEVEKSYDPVFGYYLFEGSGEEKIKGCLTSKHGWKQLGPPQMQRRYYGGALPIKTKGIRNTNKQDSQTKKLVARKTGSENN